MSLVARELIAAVHSAGGNFRIVDGRISVEASAPLPSELMKRLRALKADVFAVLAPAAPGQSALTAAATVDAIEERAGLAAARVPAVYLAAWARLNHQKPVEVSEAQWRLALDDGGQFLNAWVNEAARYRLDGRRVVRAPGRPCLVSSYNRVEEMSENSARVSGRRFFLRRRSRPFPEGDRLWDKPVGQTCRTKLGDETGVTELGDETGGTKLGDETGGTKLADGTLTVTQTRLHNQDPPDVGSRVDRSAPANAANKSKPQPIDFS